jgi:hypothetical protein
MGTSCLSVGPSAHFSSEFASGDSQSSIWNLRWKLPGGIYVAPYRVYILVPYTEFKRNCFTPVGSWGSLLSTAGSLRAGRSGVGATDRSLYRNVQTVSGAHLASYPVSTGVLSRKYSGQGMKLTSHLHLVPKLIMSAAVSVLPLYSFVAWGRKNLPLFYIQKNMLIIRNKIPRNIKYLFG